MTTRTSHPTATRDQWLDARRRLLQREKELTKLHDEIARERRTLPWVPVTHDYRFEGPSGEVSLAAIFGDCSQLLVYHFMMGPEWDEGCPSCSFWADNFNGIGVHLAHRDVAFTAVSRAPIAKIEAYKKRMGWRFPWYSSSKSSFNFDFQVSFTPEQQATSGTYNFGPAERPDEERPGLSAFVKEHGAIYHTYSAYARGLDVFNGAYQLLDLAPRGRNEAGLPWPMAWLRRHDAYNDDEL
jgi:predicted dithiol-disulfide oxidoreductase (DUF899 family)